MSATPKADALLDTIVEIIAAHGSAGIGSGPLMVMIQDTLLTWNIHTHQAAISILVATGRITNRNHHLVATQL